MEQSEDFKLKKKRTASKGNPLHLAPSTKKYMIRLRAYFNSQNNPQSSSLDNWLEAENYYNNKYPE